MPLQVLPCPCTLDFKDIAWEIILSYSLLSIFLFLLGYNHQHTNILFPILKKKKKHDSLDLTSPSSSCLISLLCFIIKLLYTVVYTLCLNSFPPVRIVTLWFHHLVKVSNVYIIISIGQVSVSSYLTRWQHHTAAATSFLMCSSPTVFWLSSFLVGFCTYFEIFLWAFYFFFFSWFLLTIPDFLILVHPGAQCLEIFFIYIHSLGNFNYFMALNTIYMLVAHRFISQAQLFLLNSILLCPKTISLKSSLGYIKVDQININKTELLTFLSQHSCSLSDLS